MKFIITEDKESKLKEIIQHLINVELKYLHDNPGMFSWDAQDALSFIDNIKIYHLTYVDGIKVWVNIYVVNPDFEDYDFITSEIQYNLKNKFPHLKIFTNEVIMQDN
jgi:hypothetical protein